MTRLRLRFGVLAILTSLSLSFSARAEAVKPRKKGAVLSAKEMAARINAHLD